MVALRPALDSDPVKRTMLLHPDLAALLGNLQDTRLQRLRGDLEMFIKGEELAVSMTPHEHKTAYMGLLAPETEGTWDIRSRDPEPGMRVFGRFVDRDAFVALEWALRSRRDPRWPEKQPLGSGKSLQYHYTQLEVIQRWNEMFPNWQPLIRSEIGELLSDKYHLV